jgi:hypothetical protein
MKVKFSKGCEKNMEVKRLRKKYGSKKVAKKIWR